MVVTPALRFFSACLVVHASAAAASTAGPTMLLIVVTHVAGDHVDWRCRAAVWRSGPPTLG